MLFSEHVPLSVLQQIVAYMSLNFLLHFHFHYVIFTMESKTTILGISNYVMCITHLVTKQLVYRGKCSSANTFLFSISSRSYEDTAQLPHNHITEVFRSKSHLKKLQKKVMVHKNIILKLTSIQLFAMKLVNLLNNKE